MQTPAQDETSGPATSTEEGVGHKGRRWRRGGGLITRVAGDTLSVRRAFGEPVRHDDVTLVPVAAVMGGSGSGDGYAQGGRAGAGDGTGGGGGGGFGVRVKPLGVYVVQGSSVTWRPTLDLNRAILGGQIVGAVAVLALSRALGRRRSRRH